MSDTATKRDHSLAERFTRETAPANLDGLAKLLSDATSRVGFVAWAVEKAQDELSAFEIDEPKGDWYRPVTSRDDLPSVSLEMVGRLTLFADAVGGAASELEKDARRIERHLAGLYDCSELCNDAAKEATDA